MKKNKIGLIIQLLLTVLVIISLVISFFKKDIFPIFEIIVGFDLLVMGFNNYKIYKRGKITFLYILFGVLIIAFGLLSLLGVI